MDFRFSDEQEQLRDTLTRYLQKAYAFEKRRAIVASEQGFSGDVWKQLADMGLLAMTLPEPDGGLGGSAVDTLVVMEAFGRALVVEPYLSTVVIAGGLIAREGSGAQRAQHLPRIAAGERRFALAHYEAQGRFDPAHVATRARKSAGGYALSGSKTVVLHGDSADTLLVSARTSGKDADATGLSLFLVDARAPGLAIRGYATQDGQRAAEITLKDVRVKADARIGREGAAFAIIERAIEHAIAALCAEAVGAMSALQEMTLAYLKTRRQFGVPIGSFQALQHRMADMLIWCEQARSMAYLAAAKVGLDDAGDRRRAVAAAKALVGQAARFVGQQAVQLHGGIGVADEFAAGHYFKRLTMINATFGDADWHLARFSDRMREEAPAKGRRPALARRA